MRFKAAFWFSFLCWLFTSCWNPNCKLKEEEVVPALVNTHVFQYYDKSITTSNSLYGVSFPSDSVGYIVGSGVVYKTMDSANTISEIISPTTQTLFDVYFLDEQNGFVAGNFAFFQTNDGGSNWSSPSIPITLSTAAFRKIGYRNNSMMFLLGGDMNNNAIMLRSTDGGTTWDDIYWSGIHGIAGMDFISDDTALICGFYGEVFLTNDRGTTWSQMTVNASVSSSAPIFLTDIKMLNSKVGFLVGNTSSGIDQLLLKTVDGGFNWNQLDMGLVPAYADVFEDLNILRGSEIVISGDNQINYTGFVIRSKDGGVTWAYDNIPSVPSIYRATSINDSEYFVGQNGTVLKRY